MVRDAVRIAGHVRARRVPTRANTRSRRAPLAASTTSLSLPQRPPVQILRPGPVGIRLPGWRMEGDLAHHAGHAGRGSVAGTSLEPHFSTVKLGLAISRRDGRDFPSSSAAEDPLGSPGLPSSFRVVRPRVQTVSVESQDAAPCGERLPARSGHWTAGPQAALLLE